ncbi:flagellar motor stator protein MotA [Sulfuriflexus mobilis]|uniref:flagellar motor stator protein MotA n=1 Tax=Sulfuriflexus mobilis TaxID=1811807 RepID=UPI000F81F93D|nr:flagellar motor stator protein MotA [Sulfuriflexus mobilis]
MLFIIGAIIVIACVAGGFVLSHGNLATIWQPYEVLIICGAAFGAFVISNPGKVIKAAFGSLLGLLKGAKYAKKDYLELLGLMFDIFAKARKEGMMSIEEHIEDTHASTLFSKYPKIVKDHHAIDFICDYLRIIVGGNMNPFELENLMDVELETHHHEAEQPAQAITRVSDALPGFGIVAAVLGIVITMGSLDQPPDVIGSHVAAALVGTFLGILFAYGFVGPAATAIEHKVADEAKYLQCIKVCMLATLNGYSPQIAVEFGRKSLFSSERPSFSELEEFLKENKAA